MQVMKSDIEQFLNDVIKQVTSNHENSSPVLHKSIWKYEHDFDFVYGQKSGMIMGMIFGYYLAKYGIEPPEDELLEIIEKIQTSIESIKNSS